MTAADLTPERFERYRRGALPPDEMLAISDLLAREPQLRAQFPAPPPGDLRALLREPEAPPDSGQLVAYVDGRLSIHERGALEARLHASPEIRDEWRADLEDLRVFRAEMEDAVRSESESAVVEEAPARRVIRPAWPVRPSFIWAAAALAMVTGAALWLLVWPLVDPTTQRLAVVPPAGASQAMIDDCRRFESGTALGELLPKELAAAPQGQLMSSSAGTSTAFRLLGPRRTFVRSDRPMLRWSALPEADAFKLVLQHDRSGEVTEHALAANTDSWRPPGPLPRGAGFTWEVIASAQGREIAKAPRLEEPPATFVVIDAARLAELEKIEAAPGLSPAVRAVALARAGLRSEAEELLGAIAGLSEERLAKERAALR